MQGSSTFHLWHCHIQHSRKGWQLLLAGLPRSRLWDWDQNAGCLSARTPGINTCWKGSQDARLGRGKRWTVVWPQNGLHEPSEKFWNQVFSQSCPELGQMAMLLNLCVISQLIQRRTTFQQHSQQLRNWVFIANGRTGCYLMAMTTRGREQRSANLW